MTESDNINHPTHYTSGDIECIDAATARLTGIEAICTADASKYLWRWKLKGGADDLGKAERYIEYLKKTLRGKKSGNRARP